MSNTKSDRPELSAAILAGGASRRMGQDKALLSLAGQTLLERAIATVASVSDDVTIVGDRAAYHRFGFPVVADLHPGTGTLGAIATALHHARHEYVLVVACDMPFLSARLLDAMARMPRDYDVLVPVTDSANPRQRGRQTYETLHAVYRRTCLAQIERRLATGQLRAFDLFADLDVVELQECWLRQYDPRLDAFVNTNYPEEWLAAMARLGGNVATEEER